MLDEDQKPPTYTVRPRSLAALGAGAAMFIGMDFGREPDYAHLPKPKAADPKKRRARKAQRAARRITRNKA